jgi:glycolate oxidase iron-sulfur subunit
MNNELEAIRQAAAACTYCGTCQAFCPVFAEVGADAASARGRLLQLCLMADGTIEGNRNLARSLTRCALCKACEEKCSSGIRTTELFLRFRKAVADRTPLPLAKRAAFTGLRARKLFDACLRLGPTFQGLLFRKAGHGPGAFARLPIPAAGLNKRRLIPRLPSTHLRRMVGETSRPGGKPRARVAFFPGCMLTYVYPQAGRALVEVLLANGVEVLLPKDVGCCGTPAIISGDFATGAVLAAHNVAALAGLDVDAVVTGCATCGTALAHEYGLALEDAPERGAWEGMKDKVKDFSDFLLELGFSRDMRPVPGAVTYHDACHLVRGMKVASQPRELLRAVPELELREMRDAARCCGCGGTFSASHYDLAARINDHKVANILATDAPTVATGCSACRMHIEDGLNRNGAQGVAVLHTAEILAKAYGR